jgi:hypothetical protein
MITTALSPRNQFTVENIAHVMSAMQLNPDLSLSAASKLFHVKPSTVERHARDFLTKVKGRYRAKKHDRLSVILYLPGVDGQARPVQTHSSAERKQISQYLRDLGRYLRGNKDALATWHGKKIAGVDLVTDGRTIMSIEPALSDFSLYRSFNGGER